MLRTYATTTVSVALLLLNPGAQARVQYSQPRPAQCERQADLSYICVMRSGEKVTVFGVPKGWHPSKDVLFEAAKCPSPHRADLEAHRWKPGEPLIAPGDIRKHVKCRQ